MTAYVIELVDGASTEVDADEISVSSGALIVSRADAPVLVLPARSWKRVQAADLVIDWTPAAAGWGGTKAEPKPHELPVPLVADEFRRR